jgi:hypothetical protein
MISIPKGDTDTVIFRPSFQNSQKLKYFELNMIDNGGANITLALSNNVRYAF